MFYYILVKLQNQGEKLYYVKSLDTHELKEMKHQN